MNKEYDLVVKIKAEEKWRQMLRVIGNIQLCLT